VLTCATCSGAGVRTLLAIDPHDLLMARDDARFHDGAKTRVLQNEVGFDFLRAQKIEQLPPAGIGSDRSDDRDGIDKFAQVARNVRRAARIKRLAGHLHHGHGRFGRDAADFAPDEFVEHQVAGDGDAFAPGAGQNFPEAIEFHEAKRA
jgi:hypothetical protein